MYDGVISEDFVAKLKQPLRETMRTESKAVRDDVFMVAPVPVGEANE